MPQKTVDVDPSVQEILIDNAYDHISESFELAMKAENIDEETIEIILGTVDDAVTNHYDSHLILADEIQTDV